MLVVLVLVLAGMLGAGGGARAAPLPERVYLWVQRDALADTLAFRELADSAVAAGCTDLLLQVRGRGEAFYRSRTEPAPPELARLPAAGESAGDRPSEETLRFDPLEEAIRICRDRGLRVHAWVNVFLVGGWGESRAAHLLLRNPEWRIRLPDGTLPETLPAAERRRLNFEGIYLDPGHPRVVPYLRGLVRELAWRYPIDGIHLDYIRYPYADAGYGEPSRQAFRDDLAAGGIPVPPGSAEETAWNAWRIGKVSEAVQALSEAARGSAPAIEVSAAVLPDLDRARDRCRQDWPRWLTEGWCDTVLLMAYTASPDRLDAWSRKIDPMRPLGGRVVYGFGLHELESDSLRRLLEWAAERREDRIALFSNKELTAREELRAVLRERLRGAGR